MIRPGDRLRSMASRVCGTAAMERLIDPVIAASDGITMGGAHRLAACGRRGLDAESRVRCDRRDPAEATGQGTRGAYNGPGQRRLTPDACSNACAICSSPQSSRWRATICRPTGSPSAVNPHGTEIAGFPTSEMK